MTSVTRDIRSFIRKLVLFVLSSTLGENRVRREKSASVGVGVKMKTEN